jgi:hypothetical protein
LRKIIDALAVTGFLLSAGLTTGAVVLYVKLPAIVYEAKAELLETVTELIPSIGTESISVEEITQPKLPF